MLKLHYLKLFNQQIVMNILYINQGQITLNINKRGLKAVIMTCSRSIDNTLNNYWLSNNLRGFLYLQFRFKDNWNAGADASGTNGGRQDSIFQWVNDDPFLYYHEFQE